MIRKLKKDLKTFLKQALFLTDVNKRQEYDQVRAMGASGFSGFSGGTNFNVEDLGDIFGNFGDIFGFGGTSEEKVKAIKLI